MESNPTVKGEGTHPGGQERGDPYGGCHVYRKHGACVCSTGYPASCQAEDREPHAEVTEHVSEYVVTAVPEDLCVDAWAWAVKVEYRGNRRWAVTHHGRCYDPDGQDEYEPIPSSREDDWLARFRHSEETALEIARRVAPTITINGIAPSDLLAKYGGPTWPNHDPSEVSGD